jgi:hypothetical protein
MVESLSVLSKRFPKIEVDVYQKRSSGRGEVLAEGKGVLIMAEALRLAVLPPWGPDRGKQLEIKIRNMKKRK